MSAGPPYDPDTEAAAEAEKLEKNARLTDLRRVATLQQLASPPQGLTSHTESPHHPPQRSQSVRDKFSNLFSRNKSDVSPPPVSKPPTPNNPNQKSTRRTRGALVFGPPRIPSKQSAQPTIHSSAHSSAKTDVPPSLPTADPTQSTLLAIPNPAPSPQQAAKTPSKYKVTALVPLPNDIPPTAQASQSMEITDINDLASNTPEPSPNSRPE